MINYTFLHNTLLNFDTIKVEDVSNIIKNTSTNTTNALNVPLYNRIKILKIKSLIDTLSNDWFGYQQISNNTTLEKVSYDLYGSSQYWDILLLVNNRMPIFDMPYDYDVISEVGETMTRDYEQRIYRKDIPSTILPNGMTTRELFIKSFEDIQTENNEKYRIIKYILETKLYDFINMCYEKDIL